MSKALPLNERTAVHLLNFVLGVDKELQIAVSLLLIEDLEKRRKVL